MQPLQETAVELLLLLGAQVPFAVAYSCAFAT
jgi:hypothetical protein